MKEGRPEKVSHALTLLLINLGGGLLINVFNFSSSLEQARAQGLGLLWLIFTLCFSLLFTALFIWKISLGKNWARITYLVLFIISVPFSIYGFLTAEASTVSIVWGIIGIILQLVALVFLFQKKSSDWFRK